MTQFKNNQQIIRFIWVTGILFFVVIVNMGCKKVLITEADVHQRIKSELPQGSTYSQVTDFLKRNDWGGKSDLSEFKNFGTHDDMLTEGEKQKIKWNSSGGIRVIEKNLFWSWGIVIEFYYDQEKKLYTYNLVKYRY